MRRIHRGDGGSILIDTSSDTSKVKVTVVSEGMGQKTAVTVGFYSSWMLPLIFDLIEHTNTYSDLPKIEEFLAAHRKKEDEADARWRALGQPEKEK